MTWINLISTNYFLNNFFSTILMFLFFLKGELFMASEVGILSSFIIFLLNIFSSNKRNLILASENKNLIYETILFRLFFFIPTFLIYLIYLALSKSINSFSIILFIIFFFLWVNEIFIVNSEIKKDKIKILINIFVIVLFFLTILQLKFDISLFKLFCFNLIFILMFIISYFFYKKKINLTIKLSLFKKIIIDNILSYSFFSSFSFLLSVFIWRFYLIEFLTEEVAIYYFIIFAIASFPGTFINNFIGGTIFKKKKMLFIKYYILLVILIIISLFAINFYIFYLTSFSKFEFLKSGAFLRIINLSFIGTLLMSLAMYFRISIFFKFIKNISFLFKADFVYGIIISLIVPTIGIFFNKYLYASYFAGSLFSILYYFVVLKINKYKKNDL